MQVVALYQHFRLRAGNGSALKLFGGCFGSGIHARPASCVQYLPCLLGWVLGLLGNDILQTKVLFSLNFLPTLLIAPQLS